MEKNNIIQSIVSKLEKIGIYPKVGEETDVEISKEFLDSKFSTGEKKISYTGLALLDDYNKTIYYYEKTKEESKGFSFGSDNETSFQSGTTLFRKIKSVGYAPDGKAYEYEIDIGQITKTFKEAAKENGWKFKIVLNPKKAKFGVGVYKKETSNINVVNTKQQFSEEYTQVQNKGDNKVEPELLNKPKKISFIYIIAIIFSILYFLVLNVNIIGWIITTIIFVILISKKDRIRNMSLLKRLFIWISIFIIIFFVGAFTMSNNYTNDNDKQLNNNVSNTNDTKDENTEYYITAESYNVLNGYEYVDGTDMKKIRPYTSANILISINNSDIERNSEIKSIKIKNAKASKAPKMGTPQFYFYDIITENSTNKTSEKHLFKNNSFEYSLEDFEKLQGVQFQYAVKDVKIQDVSSWSVIGSDNAIVKSGLKSEDVRSTITFEIEITTVSNKKYSRIFTQEIFSGDFLVDSTNGYISKDYNNEDILYFKSK